MRVSLRAIERNAPQDRAKTLEFDLRDGQGFTIGRTEGDLVLPYDGLSRKHLRLVVQRRALVAEDLNSTNGTFYQGKRIKTIPLKEADVLRVGRHTLVVDRIVPDGRENAPAIVKSVPNRERHQQKPKATATAASDFSFMRGILPDPILLWAFFRGAFGNWRTFWESHSYGGVSVERSLLVLAGTGGMSGLMGIAFAMLRLSVTQVVSIAPMTLMMSVAATVVGGLMMAAIHRLAKTFLGASGDFKSYLCFSAYAAVLCLPVGIVQGVLGYAIGSLVALVYSVWVGVGFVQAFRANPARLVMLWVGLSLLLAGGAAAMFLKVLLP